VEPAVSHIWECWRRSKKRIFGWMPYRVPLDHPGLSGFGLFDTHRADELFDIGYRQARLYRDKWEALVHDPCRQRALTAEIKTISDVI
jgi:hypothetical protein